MFKPTDRQDPLFGAEVGLPESALKRLRGSWAAHFRKKIMPILLDAELAFADLYPPEGRGCWSVSRMLAISLLQHLDDLDDQRALDCLSFDVRWQYALGLSAADAYLSRRSLVDFRRRVVAYDPDGELLRSVFDRVCDAAVEALDVSTSQQRLDSTLISSDIRQRGRISLASEVLRRFLGTLDDAQRVKLPSELTEWFGSKTEEWEQAKPKLSSQQVGEWLGLAIAAFADDESVREREGYRLMVRMLEEHVALRPADWQPEKRGVKDDPPPPDASSKSPKGPASQKHADGKRGKRPRQATSEKKARLWSIHDQDASFGHKGLGYHAHITETCGNAGTELLTDYVVVTAAQSDVGQEQSVLDRLHARGLGPQSLLADGGYPTPNGLVRARELGTELVAPVNRGRMPVETMSRADFNIDSHNQVIRCPEGQVPTRHGVRQTEQETSTTAVPYAFFDAKTCAACPSRQLCPVRPPNNPRAAETRLELSPQILARDQRWAEQHTKDWRTSYALRSGVEATMHELKKGHGMGRLRVRGKVRVGLQVALKATACNIKRWARAARSTTLTGARIAIHAVSALTAVTTTIATSLLPRRLHRSVAV